MTANLGMYVDIALLALLVVSALSAVLVRHLLSSVILLGIFSLLMASMYLVLSAPDVAMTEAAVGAGVSTILLLGALQLTGHQENASKHPIPPLVAVALTTAALIYGTFEMPGFGDINAPANQHVAAYYLEESGTEIGIPNVVTAILASYRGYDTLGEVFVIFTAGISVWLLLRDALSKKEW